MRAPSPKAQIAFGQVCLLATLLIDNGHGWLKGLSASIGLPWWLDGLLLDGIYLAGAARTPNRRPA